MLRRGILALGEAERAVHPYGCDAREHEAHGQQTRRPQGFRAKCRRALLLPQSKTPEGYSPSPRLAQQPFPRKQDSAEFSDGLQAGRPGSGKAGLPVRRSTV